MRQATTAYNIYFLRFLTVIGALVVWYRPVLWDGECKDVCTAYVDVSFNKLVLIANCSTKLASLCGALVWTTRCGFGWYYLVLMIKIGLILQRLSA